MLRRMLPFRTIVASLLLSAGIVNANTVTTNTTPLTLTINTKGFGADSSVSQTYPEGSTFTLTAKPSEGYVFQEWLGACVGNALNCPITMGVTQTVVARFAPILTVSVSGGGAVTSQPEGINCGDDCSKAFPYGDGITLTAQAAAGKVFTGWSGACSGTSTKCVLLMAGPTLVKASFATATVATTPTTPTTPSTGGNDSAGTATYYISDCQAGAHPACIPGDDTYAGTRPDAPLRTIAPINLNALPAGARVLFAQGGVWTNFAATLRNLNATASNPIVFDSYTPSWGGSAQPWLKTSRFVSFEFGTYGDTANDGGYTVRNLKLDGDGVSSWGVWARNDVHHITLDNLDISGFQIGVYSSNDGPIGTTSFTLRNSRIYRNASMGMLAGFTEALIENNTFTENNFSGSTFNHAIYLGGHGGRGIVRGNRFIRNSTVNGVCTGGNVTVHGQWDGMLFEGNHMEQTASTMGCFGFSITTGYNSAEWFRNFVVRGNTVVNLGGCAICASSAPGIVIENNVLINSQSEYNAAVVVGGEAAGGDAPDGGAIIRNNSIHYAQAGSTTTAIALLGGYGSVSAGSNIQVLSNLIYFGAASAAEHRCFYHAEVSNFALVDNNLCHHAGNNGLWSNLYPTPASAATAGLDLHGLSGDPLLAGTPTTANSWNMALQPGSPAIDAGLASGSATTDFTGAMRDARPDIGAFERR